MDSSPTLNREFTISLGRDTLWNALTDQMRLARCIPGYEDATQIDQSAFTWKGKVSVGIVSKKIEAQVKIVKRVEPDELAFTLESEDGEFSGDFVVRLSAESPSSTKMNVDATIEAQGPFKWIVDKVIESQLDKFINEFKACIAIQP
jgi:carbon monoxide dehydrogenase subunit G